MAPITHHRFNNVLGLASVIAAVGYCCNNLAAPAPASAQVKEESEIARTAKLTDSPEATAVNIGKQIKNQMTSIPTSLAKLYDFDPPDVKLSKASTDIVIMAPQQYVWEKLTGFAAYPKLFPRLKTCQVLKREGDLVYIESLLKPQMFVNQPCQHTINDLEDKPDSLKWKLTDGNFKAVEGEWKLKSIDDGQHTEVKYTMEVDPGPLIPRPIIVMALKMVQREAVLSVKAMVEHEYASSASGAGKTADGSASDKGQHDSHS
jgi:ribosome-associated toxin RatA of RatAB toxin-antitoxin module